MSACWRSSAVSKSFLLSTASAQPSGAAPPRMSATTELKFRARLQHPQTMAPAEEEDAPGSALKARDLGDAFANPDAPRALTDAGRSGMSIMSTSPTAFKGREIRVSHAPGCRFDDHTTTKDMFPGHQPEIRCALSRRRPPRRRSIDLSPVWQQHTTAALLPRAKYDRVVVTHGRQSFVSFPKKIVVSSHRPFDSPSPLLSRLLPAKGLRTSLSRTFRAPRNSAGSRRTWRRTPRTRRRRRR